LAGVAAPAAPADISLLELYERAFTRAAGSPRIEGNAVRLLRDARENYPAWLAAIRSATRTILFESYLIEDDGVGREFAVALAARAREGIRVRIVYDCLGSRGGGGLWQGLRDAGVEVRGFNPFRLDSPLGWLSRDHRKTIAIDGRIGFVSGVCLSTQWCGDPERRFEPWRDTGVEIRGPAVAELEQAFAQVWLACGGGPLAVGDMTAPDANSPAGNVAVRVIAGTPNAAGVFRLDQVIASIARQYLWLTDAYFVGLSPYVQALCAAARDGVDVRLLVPGASDIPALQTLSRAGYRPLLAGGVRVFEWNGTMLHAKTAVADGVWARVGSTNLNFASWIHNWELDIAIEDPGFAEQMAAMYEQDLANTTEIVLTRRNRVRRTEEGGARQHARHAAAGSASRAAAGALSVGSALGAALTNRRLLGPTEAGLLFKLALLALAVAAAALAWPWLLAIPLAIVAAWLGLAMLGKAWALRRQRPALDSEARSRDRPSGGDPAS
jgi:cardiolipin synthase